MHTHAKEMKATLDAIKKRYHTIQQGKRLGQEDYSALHPYAEREWSSKVLIEHYGIEIAQLYSAIQYDVHRLISLSCIPDDRVLNLIHTTSELIEHLDLNAQALRNQYAAYQNDILPQELSLKRSLALEHPVYQRICMETHTNHTYLYAYGMDLCETDFVYSDFLRQYDASALEALSVVIRDAFLHGFISQNRNRRNRTGVKMTYTLGQEGIARGVIKAFNELDIFPSIVGVTGHAPMRNYHYRHLHDQALFLDSKYVQSYKRHLESAYSAHMSGFENVCGYIGIGSFGGIELSPTPAYGGPILTAEQRLLKQDLQLFERTLNDQVIRPSDISFCKIALPNPEIRGNFEAIFEDFMQINQMPSAVYEGYQQVLIDALDQGTHVQCKGRNGNKTDIVVALNPLSNPECETNFMNCGGDLNIPHGEVFTTPQLKGTDGMLHFKNIFLKGYAYHDLELTIRNGIVTDFMCSNFQTPEENQKYILETLFQGKRNVPIGEFAIGTNTLAYAAVKRHEIIEALPILLVEKMGPHFAVGDPCYAFGEEEAVYNLLDGKEIVARENERTRCRHGDMAQAYVGLHTDITLPYEEIESLSVCSSSGQIDILRNGFFVLPGTEVLNAPLEALSAAYQIYIDFIDRFQKTFDLQKSALEDPTYFQAPVERLEQDNEALYALFAAPYETSALNPDYAMKHCGHTGRVLAAILFKMREMIPLLFQRDVRLYEAYETYLEHLRCALERREVDTLADVYTAFLNRIHAMDGYRAYTNSVYDAILEQSSEDPRVLYAYGHRITKVEYETALRLLALDEDILISAGYAAAEAFDKGLVQSGKKSFDRQMVRLQYAVGHEPLMYHIAARLRALGYTPKVTEVFSSVHLDALEADHAEDADLYVSDAYVDARLKSLETRMAALEGTLRQICGFVRILPFGAVPDSVPPAAYRLTLCSASREKMKKLAQGEREVLERYMPRAHCSYTGVAYPTAAIKGSFEHIFRDFVKINTMDSMTYERIQEFLVEALNGAEYVEVVGRGGNQTRIQVHLKVDFDVETQTVFKNTGADVNLPVGEVFTSPVLKGTSGILHAFEAYKEHFYYKDLLLTFKDGMVVNYMCRNFATPQENRAYIERTLLFPHETLPMGEFAIGTNTFAYTVAQRHKIMNTLPGLVIEKMGPHFAIGDTCFAYGEETRVLNPLSGKEMVAKDNEWTQQRLQGKSPYFHTHTDITIPCSALESLVAVHPTHRIDIIREGQFVLEGTELLNFIRG